MENKGEKVRIGLFGGTFNPPHLGHQRAAAACVRQLELTRLLLIPAFVPPHKSMPAGSATPRQRLEMTEIIARKIPRAQVCDLELSRLGPSYTCDTVEQLAGEYPGADFWLIMGTDMFLSFHKWRQPEKIARYCRLAVVAREEQEKEKIQRQQVFLKDTLGAESDVVSCPVTVLSSTQVRQDVMAGDAKRELDEDVARYIQSHGLYQPSSRLEELGKAVREHLTEKRWRHTLGVEEVAASLARQYGVPEEEAREAALLHDATKCLDIQEQLKLCRQYDIIFDYGEQNTALLHGKTAAALAQDKFGSSPQVVQAIARHTTGDRDMTTLDKIVYLADCIEPGRDYPGVDRLRSLCRQDLDQAMIQALSDTIEHVRQKGGEPDRRSQEALDDLRSKKENGK